MRATPLSVVLLLLLLLLLLGDSCASAEANASSSDTLTASSPSYGFDTIANTSVSSLIATTSSDSRDTSSSPSQTSAPTSAEHANCEWEGVTLRHGMAKYFVGRAHRRGSIYGECRDGELRCYEDAGLADAQRTHDKAVACASHSLAQRQRDLDLEDQGVALLPAA